MLGAGSDGSEDESLAPLFVRGFTSGELRTETRHVSDFTRGVRSRTELHCLKILTTLDEVSCIDLEFLVLRQ